MVKKVSAMATRRPSTPAKTRAKPTAAPTDSRAQIDKPSARPVTATTPSAQNSATASEEPVRSTLPHVVQAAVRASHDVALVTPLGVANPTGGQKEAIDVLWRNYVAIGEWIRFSDTKAAVILTANGAILTAVATAIAGSYSFLQNRKDFIGWLGVGAIFCFFSVQKSLASIWPKLKAPPTLPITQGKIRALWSLPKPYFGPPTSLIFFGHIAQRFPSPAEYERAAAEAFQDPNTTINQLSQQVWANSHVAAGKYRHVAWATVWLGFTMVIYFGGVIYALGTLLNAPSPHGPSVPALKRAAAHIDVGAVAGSDHSNVAGDIPRSHNLSPPPKGGPPNGK